MRGRGKRIAATPRTNVSGTRSAAGSPGNPNSTAKASKGAARSVKQIAVAQPGVRTIAAGRPKSPSLAKGAWIEASSTGSLVNSAIAIPTTRSSVTVITNAAEIGPNQAPAANASPVATSARMRTRQAWFSAGGAIAAAE